MEQLAHFSIVKVGDRKEVEKLQRGFTYFANENIILNQDENGKLWISSQKFLTSQIVSIMPKSRPDLFEVQLSVFSKEYKEMNSINVTNIVEPTKKKKNQIVELQSGEKDIRYLLMPDLMNEDQEELDPEHLPDLDTANKTLEEILLSDECPLLENILKELVNFNTSKWQDKTVHCIYPQMLRDANGLSRMCIGKELAIIATELHCLTGRVWYSSSSVKAENVNHIVSAFGRRKADITQTAKCKEKLYQPDTLLYIASVRLKSDQFPIEHMQIPLATVIQRRNINDWYARCTMQLKIPVPQEEKRKPPKKVELFSYPEFNSERNQLEPRTFDFTHILTNIHCQILSRGFDYCKKEHFEELCKDKPDILSISLVFDKIDTQNAFTAMRMFNYSVQRWMEQKGYTETATFIKLIRNWHDACNRRGLSADTHVRYLTDMYSFLVQGINFNSVPFQFPDRYIRGMTWQTFEALLQSISTRIQLYYMSRNFTYNARAVSTLANESFFSDLVHYNKESH